MTLQTPVTTAPAVAEAHKTGSSPLSPSDGLPGTNGQSRSRKAPASAKRKLLYLAIGAVLVAGVVVATVVATANSAGPNKDLVLHTVTYGELDQTIVERGNLESQNNCDVVCRVKAGTKNSTVATTIKELLAEDGDKVEKGQLLVRLDSSGLEDQLKTQKITRDNAKLAWDQAEGDLIIVRSKNDSDIQAAKTTKDLAEIDLEKYVNADYPAKLDDYNNQLEQWKDRVAYDNRMVKKGYMSDSQAQADYYALRKAQQNMKVLELEKKRSITQYKSALEEAIRNIERVKEQTKTNENTAIKKRDSTKKVFEQEQARADDIEAEIAKCEIKAEQAGIVVYVVPEQARWGGGSQTSIVAQGEPVREGQKLMRIPDLGKMQVTVRVHEALVASVRYGQPALIKVDPFPDQILHGHVHSVATVDSKQDFLTADVKVYQTVIVIDAKDVERLQKMEMILKPGMSSEVTILINRTPKPVLTVPVQAIVDSTEEGKGRVVFVLNEDGEPEERPVVVGMSTDKVAEIKSGLKKGDKVVLNPSRLLEEGRKKFRASSGKNGGKKNDFGPGKKGGPKGKKGPNGNGKPPFGPNAKPAFGPQAGPAQGPAAQGGGDRQKQMLDMFRKASPAQRKQMLEQVPAEFRDKARQGLKAQGIDVPN
jgi:multidrug efflux pump subunit AcrA (membrane-fusion protein)